MFMYLSEIDHGSETYYEVRNDLFDYLRQQIQIVDQQPSY
jgi:sortase (surface protein transpeptidase)